ncbi:MAG: OB-fold-containig protein, partial [Geminicoccaceae bacterium]
KVPLLVVIVAFLTVFGLSGLILQNLWSGITGSMLPASLASLPALVVGLITTRYLALGLARLIPSSETSAVSSDSFVGRVAVLTLGTAATGKPAQAKLTDGYGQAHYLMVEPDQTDMVFQQGDRILLVGRKAGVFKGIPNESDVLVDH